MDYKIIFHPLLDFDKVLYDNRGRRIFLSEENEYKILFMFCGLEEGFTQCQLASRKRLDKILDKY